MAGILCVQINSEQGDKSENLKKTDLLMEQSSNKKLDLVLFPEFFSTSIAYQSEPEPENGGFVIEHVCELAKKYHTNIVAGTIVRKAGDKYFNTSFAINRQGEVVAKYDKIHLYNFMGGNEGAFTSAGNEIVTVDFDFAKVGMAICFDVRYPLHFNKLIKEKVDIITLPTAWLVPAEVYRYNLDYAREMWVSMNRTRAYDNMVYFAVCNQTGKVNDDLYGIGSSMIISPTAEVLAKIDNGEGVIYSDIEVSNVDFMRQIFPIAKID
ncbi:carbon-nitrogen hydrolase family protein [bacterium]|nr:carbon-nitrogen hydrolase family protein [bacterium]